MKKLLVFVLVLLFSFVNIIFTKDVSSNEIEVNDILKVLVGDTETKPWSFSVVMTSFETNEQTVLNATKDDYITKTKTTLPVLQMSVQYKVLKFAVLGSYSLGGGINQEMSSTNISGNVYISTPIHLGIRYYGIEDDNFKMFFGFGGKWSYINEGNFVYTTYEIDKRTIDHVEDLQTSLDNYGLSTFCQIGIETRIKKFLWLTIGMTFSDTKMTVRVPDSTETTLIKGSLTWTGVKMIF